MHEQKTISPWVFPLFGGLAFAEIRSIALSGRRISLGSSSLSRTNWSMTKRSVGTLEVEVWTKKDQRPQQRELLKLEGQPLPRVASLRTLAPPKEEWEEVKRRIARQLAEDPNPGLSAFIRWARSKE